MYHRKKRKGLPYTFQEFAFFSPKQFDALVPVEEKDMLFKLMICTNSNRVFSGPFFMEGVGQYEVTEKELKKMLKIVNETPDLIMYCEEYTITDDYNGLWKYYGKEGETPLAHIVREDYIDLAK
jgi:hypothetical protein